MFAALFCAALFTIVALVACSTRGEDCESDSDCDSQQSCISPGCGGPKKCAITCGTDADCKSKGGDDNDRCVKPNKDCVASCTPGATSSALTAELSRKGFARAIENLSLH